MNIVIPMAGLGTRFSQEGFVLPKPLIEINGKTLIEHSIESLNIKGKYIFITRNYENKDHNLLLSNKLKSLVPDCEEIKIDHVTSGASETCLFAKKFINNNESLIITNCDQRLEWDSNKFLSFINENSYDGIIVTHESNNPKHSYADVDENDFILDLKEKKVISKYALIGLHYWSKGEDFINSAENLLNNFKNEKKPECYISETYNYLIECGKKIKNYLLPNEQYIPLGTPYDLNIYNGKIKEFYTDKPKTIFCDIDGTILNHLHKFSVITDSNQSLLEGVVEKFNEWDSHGHKIILCTARKESARKMTEDSLKRLGICWDVLLMGLTSGVRVLINDKINDNIQDRAIGVNLITNSGFKKVDWRKINL